MSSASVTSSKRETAADQVVQKCQAIRVFIKSKVTTELSQEIESVKAMNSSLRAYLEHLRVFKKNLVAINENCTQLNKVNKQWIETLSSMK